MSSDKRNRYPLPDNPVFASRGSKVKWPTLRGTYLDDVRVEALRRTAHGVIFLDGMYDTRLNFGMKESRERAIFFEHLHKVDDAYLFLLIWIGNYLDGSIFHCAWQFPQHLHWSTTSLSWAAFRTYKRIVGIMYNGIEMDKEVAEFTRRGNA